MFAQLPNSSELRITLPVCKAAAPKLQTLARLLSVTNARAFDVTLTTFDSNEAVQRLCASAQRSSRHKLQIGQLHCFVGACGELLFANSLLWSHQDAPRSMYKVPTFRHDPGPRCWQLLGQPQDTSGLDHARSDSRRGHAQASTELETAFLSFFRAILSLA